MTPRAVRAGLLVAASALFSLAYLYGCGGSDGGGTPPSPATKMMTALTTDMTRGLTRMGMLETGTVLIMNPGSTLSPNVTSAPDTSAGAPPNTVIYGGKYDGNADGSDETSVDWRVTFANDPNDLFNGFNGGQGGGTVDINILSLMHVYHGNIAFDLGMSEHRVSGTGTFSNPVSGTTTTMTASASDPLTMKLADGTANARANACAHSFHGAVQLSVAGSDGTLASQWRFAGDSSTVAVTGATFTTPGGQSTAIPDTSVDLGCDGANNINDWVGRYQIRWACLPAEFGEFTTRITVKNSTTVSMLDDEDTPDEAYEATVIGTSARAIRGFFIDGPDGARYREDFNWTLNPNGSGFSQTSRYRYIEGTQVGLGGICVARATRIP
jgi:hypothetical protein